MPSYLLFIFDMQTCFRGLANFIVQTASGVSCCRERKETSGKGRASAENWKRREEPLQVSLSAYPSDKTLHDFSVMEGTQCLCSIPLAAEQAASVIRVWDEVGFLWGSFRSLNHGLCRTLQDAYVLLTFHVITLHDDPVMFALTIAQFTDL